MKTNLLENAMIGFDQLLTQLHRPYTTYPPYNVLKTEDGYILELAVAGFNKSELEVEISGGELVIRGTKESTTPQHYLYQGLAHRSWTRRFVLDPQLQVTGSTLVNGVLVITLTNTNPSNSQKIEIK